MAARQPRLLLRIEFHGGRLGPGKVELLEHIARERSIAAAARAMDMSYKRAWELIDTMNHMFREPVVTTLPGRNIAGSTALTDFGHRVIDEYRAIETAAFEAARPSLRRLSRALKPSAQTAAAGREPGDPVPTRPTEPLATRTATAAVPKSHRTASGRARR